MDRYAPSTHSSAAIALLLSVACIIVECFQQTQLEMREVNPDRDQVYEVPGTSMAHSESSNVISWKTIQPGCVLRLFHKARQ